MAQFRPPLAALAVLVLAGAPALAQKAADPPAASVVGPRVAMSVGPINFRSPNAGVFVVVSFRDPQGRSYPSSGVPVNLSILGPAGWGEDLEYSGNDYDYSTYFELDRSFRPGGYTVFGTIGGQTVQRLNLTVPDGGPPLDVPNGLKVNSTFDGKTVEVSWGGAAGARSYEVGLLDSQGRVVAGLFTRDRSVTLHPQAPLNPSDQYAVAVFAFDLERLNLEPGSLPARMNASLAVSDAFNPGQRLGQAQPPVAGLSLLPAALLGRG